MRYYAIKLSGSVPSAFQAAGGAAISGAQWCSVINGKNDPGALNIEMDVTITPTGSGATGGWVRIWGIPMEQISQAAKLADCKIEVYGGFTEGLPLATAQVPHQGLLFAGAVYYALGNWEMSNMTLDIFIKPLSDFKRGTNSDPNNIVHNMPANTPLSQAIKTTLNTAFPGKQIVMNISDKLKLGYQDAGFYANLTQYAAYIRNLSFNIKNGPQNQATGASSSSTKSKYQGISIVPFGDKILVHDFEQPGDKIKIDYIDLVGQPSWVEKDTLSIKTVMRSDFFPGKTATLPETLATVSSSIEAASSQTGSSKAFGGDRKMTFQGDVPINSVRHVGNFRQPGGDSWVTVMRGVLPPAGGSGDGGDKTPGGKDGTAEDQAAATNPDGSTPVGNSNSIGPGNFDKPSTFVPEKASSATVNNGFVPNPALGGRH